MEEWDIADLHGSPARRPQHARPCPTVRTTLHRSQTTATLLAGALALVLGLAGCADAWDTPHPEPSAIGTPGAGFLPTPTPSPEATVRPVAGSWADVHPSPGMRVVLLTAGDDEPTRALASAVQRWASDEGVDLRTVEADGDLTGGIVSAMGMDPDLIVSAGNDLVDPLATVSPNHLGQQFLVIGAEIPEPTYNVTSVDWAGASFRGEGLGGASVFDPASFTPERCGDAIRAGVAAVLTGLTGFVLWID